MQHFCLEPQACMKSDLVCAGWNNSYGRMNPNSRNTTCWSFPEIGPVSHCASVGQRGLQREALVITAPQGSLSDHSSSLHTLFTFWSATPSSIIPVQMDVYLDSRPEQDFIVISVEGDSENITLGFQPARKLLLSRVNTKITHCKHRGRKERALSLRRDWGDEMSVCILSGFYKCKCLVYEGLRASLLSSTLILKSDFHQGVVKVLCF